MRVPSVDDETSRKFRVFVHTCVKAAVTAVSSVMQQVLESAQAAFVERAAGIKELYRRDLQRVRAIAAQRGPALPLTNDPPPHTHTHTQRYGGGNVWAGPRRV